MKVVLAVLENYKENDITSIIEILQVSFPKDSVLNPTLFPLNFLCLVCVVAHNFNAFIHCSTQTMWDSTWIFRAGN